jgi:hypothetical protein
VVAVTLMVLEGRAGVTDPTLRVLPEDPAATGVVRLPGETALATWVAHRCHRSLEPIFAELERLSGGSELVCMLTCFGLPVRATRRSPEGCRDSRCIGEDGPRVSHAGSVPVDTDACNQSSR